LFNLLSEYKLLVRRRKRRIPQTTFSNHWQKKYPNLIRGIRPIEAHQIWVSDITYIRYRDDEFAYLSLITDVYSRKIVGYHLNNTLSTSGCIHALDKALQQLPDEYALIHHSDRGCQYCSYDYISLLKENNIEISMTQSGDPLENAIAERVNGILKDELLEEYFPDFKTAQNSVSKAISIYNNIRLHSSIEMLTPEQAHTMKGEFKRRWNTYYRKEKGGIMSTK